MEMDRKNNYRSLVYRNGKPQVNSNSDLPRVGAQNFLKKIHLGSFFLKSTERKDLN